MLLCFLSLFSFRRHNPSLSSGAMAKWLALHTCLGSVARRRRRRRHKSYRSFSAAALTYFVREEEKREEGLSPPPSPFRGNNSFTHDPPGDSPNLYLKSCFLVPYKRVFQI